MSEKEEQRRPSSTRDLPQTKPGGFQGGMRVSPDATEVVEADQRQTTAPAEPFSRGVVERGHTVQAPTGEHRFVGYDRDGTVVMGPELKMFGPGEEVRLPVSEINRLRGLGFIVDPGRKVPRPPESPRGSPRNDRGAYVQTSDDGVRVVEQG